MRRSITVLAAGFLGLVAISPVLASGESTGGDLPSAMEPTTSSSSPAPYQSPTTSSTSPAPYQSPTSSTSTTMPAPDDDTAPPDDDNTAPPDDDNTAPPDDNASPPADNCVPATEQAPAPAEGTSEMFEAGEAGTVEVERVSATELAIGEVTPKDGWTHQVTGPNGPRVKVRFDNPTASPSRIRFAANMDDAGTEIHIRVTSCE